MKKSMNNLLILVFLILFLAFLPASANDSGTLIGGISDPMVEAQEKFLRAKGSYSTVKEQERAIKDLKKAIKLNLRASTLRSKAEKLQTKADGLVNKANQQALSRGLYITNPLVPMMMQPPPSAQQRTASGQTAPIPGQPINIILPKQESVSYDQYNNPLPEAPVPDSGF